jgi:hypothetical protein
VAIFALAGGIAYASIPDADTGVYHACMLKNGTLRVIDPASDRCNAKNETEITFNQKGAQGSPGANGVNGTNGVSPTVTQLGADDAHCPSGGAAITDAAGSTAYVCSGANGADGTPFSGTFTSPNGLYSIAVTDTGVTLTGQGPSVGVSGTGVRVETSAGLTLEGGLTTLEGAGALTIKGGVVTVNGGGSCHPAARLGDFVNGGYVPFGGGPLIENALIATGSPTVCIG